MAHKTVGDYDSDKKLDSNEEDSGEAPAIGIDLGTTYSCVGVFINGSVEIIANDQGNRTMPSYVAFTKTERLIGEAAKNQVAMNPMNTFYDTKRLIGRHLSDETVQSDIKHLSYSIDPNHEKIQIKTEYKGVKKNMFPEELSSMVLVKMKQTAEAFLGKTVKNAVITVPAYFNNSQRQATKDAGTIAGLNVLRIINEPTAAAIAYGIENESKKEVNILIFDLGGGTFDVSILTIEDNIFEVKATSGDTHLGGEDFDSRLVDYLVMEFQKKNGINISGDKRSIRRMRTQCEKAKRLLSSSTQAKIEIPCLYNGIDFDITISRARFEELNSDLFMETLTPVQKALDDSGLKKSDIDEIILVGGSTRIPKIQKLLQEFFSNKKINKSINPDEAVAYGAAIQAAILKGDNSKVLQDILLLDVSPLSLGINILGGAMSTIVKRNTILPVKNTNTYYTTADYQTSVNIEIFEGERAMTSANNLLGNFILKDIPSKRRGVEPNDVTFEIDSDGLLKVTAKTCSTNNSEKITIVNQEGRFTQQEIDKMLSDATKFKEDDIQFRIRVECMNKLENYAYKLRSSLNEHNIKDHDKNILKNKCEETISWIDNNQLAERREYEMKQYQLEKMFADMSL